MAFRCLALSILVTFGLLATSAARAADCVEVRNDEVRLTPESARCGSLRIVERRREGWPKVDFFAAYPLFDPVRDEAERLYNEWVSRRPGQMNFSGPVDLTRGDVADTMVGTLYRSPRLLSASIGGWMCCGAHGITWAGSLNLDSRTGQEVQLADLVKAVDVTDHCWTQFSKLDGPMDRQGDVFARTYPSERFGRLDPGPLWNMSAGQLTLRYGYLLGYAGAEFTCTIATAELPRFAKKGVTVPF